MSEAARGILEELDLSASQHWAPSASSYHLTELGNAERIAKRYGAELRYVHDWGRWLEWLNETRWAADHHGGAEQRAIDMVRSLYGEAADATTQAEREALGKWAVTSEKAAVIRNSLALAEALLALRSDALDPDPWLLNVSNGTLAIRDRVTLRPHRCQDYITKLAPVAYDREADCPRWLDFLERIFGGDADLISFVQRALGLSLIGKISEHVLLIAYGTGANGKTTLINVVLGILGDYARQADPELLLAHRGDVHPTNVADLQGVRFVVASEVDQGRRLAEALLKQLTGGDRRKARFMRRDFFEYDPSDTIWLTTNHKPIVRGTDNAIWRRLQLIPFNVTIPAGEQDPGLIDKLLAEAPGILNWILAGCLTYQDRGLGDPAAVDNATAIYRAEQDVVAAFLEDVCLVDPDAWAATADLWSAYTEWCRDNGERGTSKRGFTDTLQEHGFAPERSANRAQRRGWRGLCLKSHADAVDTADT